MSKVLTVFGATGNQGGSVIKTVLAHPELSKTYKIRAVTRDTSKPAAVALKEKGAEVVTADLDDLESLKKAIQGSSVVFGVTNFWEHIDGAKETQQGKNLADASKAANVDRFIFSSLIDVSKATNGANTRVKHFDSKAAVEAHARSIGLSSTFYLPAVFLSGVLDFFKPDEAKQVYTFTAPLPETSKMPLVDPANDTGKFVAGALLNLSGTEGTRIIGATQELSPAELAQIFEQVTGKTARYQRVPYEVFKSFLPPPIADELTANFELIESPGYYAGEPPGALEKSIKLAESAGAGELSNWSAYVKEHFKA